MFISTVRLLVIWMGYFNPENKLSTDTMINSPRAYYVSPFGNDKNPGTRMEPFRSINRINQQQLAAGDSILFQSGQIFTGHLELNNNLYAGSIRSLYISSYGKGFASIAAGNGAAILVKNCSQVHISRLKLLGSGRKKGNTQNGLLIFSSQHITADSLEISGFQKSGICIDSSADIRITHIRAFQNGYAGISVGGTGISKNINRRIYIGWSRAENNPGDPSNSKNHSGNGIVVSSCTDVLIEYCTATNNGWDMPRKGNGPVGIWAFEADSVTIQHCLSYRNKTSFGSADGGGFDFDGGVTNSMVQYCLSYENQGAGYCIFQYSGASAWHDNIFRFNISKNDGLVSEARAGVFVWNSSMDSLLFYNNQFYNNTIYNTKGSAIRYSTTSERKNFSFYNNIFIARDSLIAGEKSADDFAGNYWSPLKGKIYQSFSAQKTDMPETIPASGFTNLKIYQITSESALYQQGVNLKQQYHIQTGDTDFNGSKPPEKGIGANFEKK